VAKKRDSEPANPYMRKEATAQARKFICQSPEGVEEIGIGIGILRDERKGHCQVTGRSYLRGVATTIQSVRSSNHVKKRAAGIPLTN
jgi:hypothetical protein